MKKYLFGMSVVAMVVMVSVFCSCGNKGNVKQVEDAADSVAVESTGTDPVAAKGFIESMYKDFFENKNFDTENISNLQKYLSPSVVERIKMECPYEGGEGDFSYVVDFFCDGALSYERPDYGGKVVSRTIEPEDNDWFLVTNIWDVIKKPVKVHLEVKSVDGAYKIVDIRVDDKEDQVVASDNDDKCEMYSKQEIQSMKTFLEAFYDKMDTMGMIDEKQIEKNVTINAQKTLKENGNDLLTQDEEHCGEVQSTKITHIGDNYFEVCITYYVERTYYDDYKVKLSVVKDGGSYKIDTIEKGKMK